MSFTRFFQRFYFRYASRLRNLKHHFQQANLPALRTQQQKLFQSNKLPWLRLIHASWSYGASFDDYFRLGFYKKDKAECKSYLTTSLRFELDTQLNAQDKRVILKDKQRCRDHFREFLGRPVWTWEELQEQPSNEAAPRMVAKDRWGQLGQSMFFFAASENWEQCRQNLAARLTQPENYMYEPYFVQHASLQALNPGSVNTLQMITCLQGTEVQIWNCILRMGLGEGTDHFSRGGLAAWVNEMGQITKPAVSRDPLSEGVWEHPISHVSFKNMQIPFFQEAKALVKRAALSLPELRSVSWDVAISPEGPCLLEGNHNWSHQTAQIPKGEGLRHLANQVADMHAVYD